MFFLLIIALIAAGIFTHAVIWYIIAGILGCFWAIISLIALAGASVAIKKMSKDFKDFDNNFFKNHPRGGGRR